MTATPLVRRYHVDLARTCSALCRPVPLPSTSRQGLVTMPRPVRALG